MQGQQENRTEGLGPVGAHVSAFHARDALLFKTVTPCTH